MDRKTVLILGGGVGGVVAANVLSRQLGREHRIALVEKSPKHLFSPSLPWVVAGWRRPEQITKDVRRMVHPRVEVTQAEVEAVQPEKHQVKAGGRDLDYDYLVVALGADLAPEAMPGYSEAAHNFFALDGAARLATVLKEFPGGRVVVVVSRLPYKCPAAPYEAALLLSDVFRRRGLRDRVTLDLYTPEVLPMPVAGPVLGQAVKGMLEEKDIAFHPSVQLESVDPKGKGLKFQGGGTVAFDLLVAVPPHRAPQALKGSGLVNEAGWIPVDARTLRTRYDKVFAVGDVTSITLPNGKPLPRAGVFAHAEAQVVAHRIAAEVQGAGSTESFDGFGYCSIEMGDGRAGFASGNFYAEPDPAVRLQRPGRLWHWGRGLFETYWMGDGLGRIGSKWSLALGSRLFGVPAFL